MQNNHGWTSTVPGDRLSATRQKPNTNFTVKDLDASNNRPKPIAGCQKPIHNVKEPEDRDQMTDVRSDTRSPNSLLLPNSLPNPTATQSGGADRNRTDDLLRAKQALSQLSYGPAARRQRPEDRKQMTEPNSLSVLCRLTSVF
jgi:hypothetical protein